MNQLEDQLRDQLRRSEQDIDPQTTRRLSQARDSALALSTGNNPWWRSQFTLTRGVALASVLAFAVVLYPTVPGNDFSPAGGASYISSEGDDLYENIDFYLWMANSENNLAG